MQIYGSEFLIYLRNPFMQPVNNYVKRIWNLSWPIILGQVSYVLMGIADNIMVGKVSSAAVAAVGFCNTIFFTVSIIGIGILNISL